MSSVQIENKIRPLVLEDLDAIFYIDHEIRRRGQAITYANLTTEHVFGIDRHVGILGTPLSYADLIKGDISELLEFGLVAEVENHVRGFVLGRIGHCSDTTAGIGTIAILGVHPDYQHRGIAGQLINGLCETYRSKGIKRVRVNVDRRDKLMTDFVEYMGFGVGHLIDYTKVLT